jgi:hypothetical protein
MYVTVLLLTLIVLAQPLIAHPLFQAVPIEVPKLTADLLVTVTGVFLSALAYIIPPFRRWQEKLGEWTPLVMALALLGCAVVYQAAWCNWVWGCVLVNWQGTLLIAGTAFGLNAGMFSTTIKPAKKREKAKIAAASAAELIYVDEDFRS